jgi:hypothetical protein
MHGNGDPLVPPPNARRHHAAQATTNNRPHNYKCIAMEKNKQ